MNAKKIFIRLIAIIGILLIYGFYKQYSFNEPDILFESHLSKTGVTEEYEFSVKQKNYVIGLAINEKTVSWGSRIDGNYTIEYYKDGKFLKKELIDKVSISKYYQGLYHISGSSSVSSWKQMTLGKVKDTGHYKISITVNKPEPQLDSYTGKLYFFANKSNDKLMKEFNSFYTLEKKAYYKKMKLLKNLIDANETNSTLIPLRIALNKNEIEVVKSIIESDNNITVNTDMVFGRRALFYAAFNNNVELCKYLIKKGSDIHHKDELEKNALAYAIENNALETVSLLIKSGIKVSEVEFVQNYLQYKIKGKHYPKEIAMSALQYTAGNDLYEMTELLLKNGMKDNVLVWMGSNINVDTYLRFLTKEEKRKMLELFEKYGHKVERIKQEPLFKKG